MSAWACFFLDEQGEVLRSDGFDSPEAAGLWGHLIMTSPADHLLERPNGETVPATTAAFAHGCSIEAIEAADSNTEDAAA